MSDTTQNTGPRTIVLAGGGTGGHVYPALAMGDALAGRGHRILYFGDPTRLEGRVVPARGIPFTAVPAVAFPRAGLLAKVRFAFGLLRATLLSRGQLKAAGADFVLGVGGYVSAPPVLAAWTLGIPTAVHEANVTPGLANRLCARVARLVLLTYSQTGAKLPGKAPRETVGCPVNPKVLSGDRAAAAKRYGLDPSRPTLLVVGGSLGAAAINQVGIAAAKLPGRSWQVLLISGPKYEAEVRAAVGSPLPEGVALLGYEDRMVDAYAMADVVLCRAGSSTLAELTAVGRPGVLIPSPNVTDNHQEGNARGLEQVGAAVVFTEGQLKTADGIDPGPVLKRVGELLGDPAALTRMSEAARAQARLDTAERVATLVEGLL